MVTFCLLSFTCSNNDVGTFVKAKGCGMAYSHIKLYLILFVLFQRLSKTKLAALRKEKCLFATVRDHFNEL